MGKHITMEAVQRLGDIRLKDLVSVKGGESAVDILHEAIQKENVRIGCIGVECTGKSSVLKAIIKDMGYFDEKETCDEVKDEREAKFVMSKRCKFFTMRAENIEDMLDKLREMSGKEIMEPCIIVTCKADREKKFICSIDEIFIMDGFNGINNLVTYNKEKLHRVSDISYMI